MWSYQFYDGIYTIASTIFLNLLSKLISDVMESFESMISCGWQLLHSHYVRCKAQEIDFIKSGLHPLFQDSMNSLENSQ